MKKFNWSLVVGCLILAVAVILASQGIMEAIRTAPTSAVPHVLDINNHDSTAFGDFLHEYEAAEYLKIDADTLDTWIASGALNGTFTRVEFLKTDENGQKFADGTECVFSKAKLTEFMNNRINSESAQTASNAK